MTKDEHALIESQFKSLATLFETKLKASECVICEKMTGLEEKFEETKAVVDDHVGWHNSINRRIVGGVVKYGLITFAIVVVIVVVLGLKDGIIPAVIAKMLGA